MGTKTMLVERPIGDLTNITMLQSYPTSSVSPTPQHSLAHGHSFPVCACIASCCRHDYYQTRRPGTPAVLTNVVPLHRGLPAKWFTHLISLIRSALRLPCCSSVPKSQFSRASSRAPLLHNSRNSGETLRAMVCQPLLL